jgi:hypothetical protein
MFKKILLNTDISMEDRERQLQRMHKFLRDVDEPFYMLWISLRRDNATYRNFFVTPDKSLKGFRHAHMLGYWGDNDRVTPEAVVKTLSGEDKVMTSRLGYTKPINATMFEAFAS